MRLSLVIPAYNEAESLPHLFAEIRKVCEAEKIEYEALVVDDGSRDETLELLAHLHGNHPRRFTFLHLAKNGGKAEAVRQGYHVVTTEPSAALCLTHEYPNLLDDDDARLVAQNTSEACSYLWRMHQAGQLELDFKPVNFTLGYHQPCHLRALNIGSPGENLLRLIPGLTVQHIEQGCSGMAGTFGLKRKNYRSSLRAGWGLISAMRDADIQFGTTECSACKMQMEQGTAKSTIHPLKILAHSYGLLPNAERLFNTRGEDLVVT